MASNRLILFGGNSCAGFSFNDVWVLTNADGTGAPQWIQLSLTGGPPTARSNHTAVYDAANNRMIIYSGCTAGCTPIVNDVWVLSNANGLGGTPTWTPLSTAGIPAGRNNHRAAYDPVTNRMIMFGGQDGGGSLSTVFEQVWVLTNANGLETGTPTWSQLSPTGAPASGTIGYYLGFMVYDSAANRMTVFGGLPKSPPAASTDRNSVWVLSNANGLGAPAWTNTVAQGAAGSPPNQAAGAIVSDTANNIATLFNFLGSPAIPRTWTLSHVNGLGGPSVWTEMFPAGGSPGSPHSLNSPAYNAASNRMIVFTNSATQANTNEVWVLTDATGVVPIVSAQAVDDSVWVTNAASGTVSRISKSAGTVTATIAVGSSPVSVAVDQDSVWVANLSSHTVSRINKSTGMVTATIPVGSGPYGVAVDQGSAWVVNSTSGTVSRINKSTGMVTATIPVGSGSQGIAVDQDSVWVTNAASHTVSRINKSTGMVTATIPVGYIPHGIAVDQDSVWVTNGGDNNVSRINKSTDTVTATIPVGSAPVGVAVDQDSVWVANRDSNTVSRINKSTGTVTATIPVGSIPIGVGVDQDSVWVTNNSSNTVSRISKSTGAVTATIAVGSGPFSLGDMTGFAYDSLRAIPPPVSEWRFDETGGSIAIDSVGGNAATLLDGASFVQGLVGNALGLDGVGARAEVADSANLRLAAQVTVEALIRLDAPAPLGPQPAPIVAKWGSQSTGSAGYGLFLVPGTNTARFLLSPDGSSVVGSAVSGRLALGTWHHVLGTYDGATLSFYVDGRLVSQAAGGGAVFPTTAPLVMGNYSPAATPAGEIAASWKGRLDQVAVFAQALDADTVRRLAEEALALRAYVTNLDDGTVSVLVPATNTVVDTVTVGSLPHGVALTPDGTRAYVADFGANALSVINTFDDTVSTVVGIDGPVGVKIRPDGARAYVTNRSAGTITVLDPETNTVLATIPDSAATPLYMALSPDGTRLWVAHESGNLVTVYDTTNMTAPPITIGVGASPVEIAISPDGAFAYVANFGSNTVSVVATPTYLLANTISVGSNPHGAAITPDGARVYVANRGSATLTPGFGTDTVSVIDTATNTVVATIPLGVGTGPEAVAVTPDGRRVYVTKLFTGGVAVIDTATNTVVGNISVGAKPAQIALGPTAAPAPTAAATADLAIAATAPTTVLTGGTLIYPVTVTNNGPSTATGVVVTMPVPAGTTLTGSLPVFCSAGSIVTCALGTIAPLSAAVSFNVPVLITAGGGVVTATIGVAGTSSDPQPANNSVTLTTTVLAGGTIQGQVKNAIGQPIAGALVSAGGFTALTGTNGDYFLTGLGAGTYFVQAQADGYATTWYNNKPSNFGADPVVVGGGGTTGPIDFALAGNAGSISGTVTDSGLGLPGVQITVFLVGAVLTATTDAAGHYSTGPRLGPGPFKVLATRDGYGQQFYLGANSFEDATPVGVSPGSDTGNINFALTAGGGPVTGTITLAGTGAPLAGAQITVYDGADHVVAGAMTFGAGTYSTNQLPPGVYRVQARGPGVVPQFYSNKPDFASADPVTVPSVGAGVANFVMTLGAVITGVVLDQFAEPITGATVEIYDGATNFFIDGGFVTDGSGRYTTNGLAGGSYKVRARAAGFVATFAGGATTFSTAQAISAAVGTTTTAPDIVMAAGKSIRGTVRDALNPLAGANVAIFDSGNGFVTSVFTAGDGTYDTGGTLGPGSYKVQASTNGYASQAYNSKRGLNGADLVTVTSGGDTTGINFNLLAGGGLSGRVTDEATTPIAGAIVDVADPVNNQFIAGGFVTDANGVWSSGLQLAGSYKIKARVPPPLSYVDTFYAVAPAIGWDFPTATAVAVTPGIVTPGYNIRMPVGATLSGVVTASGGPLGNALVVAGRFNSNNYFGTFSVRTDASGAFTIRGLRAGEWTLRFERTGYMTSFWTGQATSGTDGGTATPIMVGPGATLSGYGIGLEAGGGTITGRVTRTDSAPVPQNTAVQAFVAAGGTFPRTGFVTQVGTFDTLGNYTISGLRAGKYIIQVFPAGGQGGAATGWYPAGALSSGSALPVIVTNGDTTSGIDVVLQGFPTPTAPRTISGFVYQGTPDNPMRFGSVSAIEPNFQFGVRGASINADGTFTIGNLPPGRYILRAFAESGLESRIWPNETSVSAGSDVDVTTGNVGGLILTLPGPAATIGGKITDGNNNPVMGAQVNVANFFSNSIQSATSIADGTYMIRGLAPGFYKVRVRTTPGFAPRYHTTDGQGGHTFDEGSFVQVVPGTALTGINITLEASGGGFTGIAVRDGDGALISNAAIDIRDAVTGASITSAVTRADGTFQALDLRAGTYKFRFTNRGYAAEWLTDAPNREAADVFDTSDPPLLAFSVGQTQGSFSGRVFLSDDVTPLVGAGIVALDQTGGFVVGGGVTDSQGRYTVRGLAPGTYYAQARALGYARLFYGGVVDRTSASPIVVADVDLPNINVSLPPSGDIQGTIYYFGAQGGSLQVDLYSDAALTHRLYRVTIPNPHFPQAYQFQLPPPDIQGVAPGSYYVRAFVDSAPNGTFDPGEAVGSHLGAIAVTSSATAGGITAGVDVTLFDSPGTTADLSVTLALAAKHAIGSTALAGVVVANAGPGYAVGAILSATVPQGVTLTATVLPGCVTTGATFSCPLGDLAPGAVTPTVLLVTDVAGTPRTVTLTASVSSATADPFGANNTATLSTMFFAPTTITGTVFSGPPGGSTSTPLPGATVTLWSPNTAAPLASQPTDSAGNYAFGGLFPQAYKVSAEKDGFATRFYNGFTNYSAAVFVFPPATNINVFVPSAAGGIKGQVTDATNNGLANATIIVRVNTGDPTLGNLVERLTTNALGFYDTGRKLGNGSYTVRATLTGYGSRYYNGAASVATAALVPVTAGSDTPEINIQLSSAAGTISGRITSAATGEGVDGAGVAFFDAATDSLVSNTVADDRGNYTSGITLAPGTYKVRASAFGFPATFYDGKATFTTADVVTVTSGGTTAVSIAFPGFGGITGQVKDKMGTLLAGVVVEAYTATSINSSQTLLASATTGSDGRYTIPRVLAPGVGQKLKARVFGYIHTFWPSGIDFSTATPVIVPAAADATNIDFALPTGGRISGTIRDIVGSAGSALGCVQPEPCAGAFVQRVASNNFFGTFFANVNTAGEFTITGLHDGEWLLTATAPGYRLGWYSGEDVPATDFATAKPITISGGNVVIGADVRLRFGDGAISGQVTRSTNGLAAPNVNIRIRGPFPRASAVSGTFFADANGVYTATGLAPGQYVVEAVQNQSSNGWAIGFYPTGATSRGTALPVTVEAGVTTSGIDFQVPSVFGGSSPRTISGRLSDSGGHPISFAFIFVYEPVAQSFIRAVGVNGDGSYLMDGLPPGRYLIAANTEQTYAAMAYPSEAMLAAGTLVDVTAGNATGIDLALPAGGTITGHIRNRATGGPITGAGISVRNFFDNGPPVQGGASRVDGSYLVRGVPPGYYKVRVTFPGWAPAYYAPGGSVPGFDQAAFVTVTAGVQTPDIDVDLDAVTGVLTGTVTDTSGATLMGAGVNVRDAATGSTVTSVNTLADGTYIVGGFAPGDYKIRVSEPSHALQWSGGATTREAAAVVTVGAGAPTVANFTLAIPHGSIAGRIASNKAFAVGLPDAGVVVFDAATGGFVRGGGVTDHAGRYRVDGLPPGSYYAQARALGYSSNFFGSAPNAALSVPVPVADSVTTDNIDFRMFESSAIAGSISYTGGQAGVVRFELFFDAAYTMRAYAQTVTATALPAFPRAYTFLSPAPDTRGILPTTYFVRAFVDANGNGVLDASEPSFTGQVSVPEEGTTVTYNLTLADPGAATADLSVTKTAFPFGDVFPDSTLSYSFTVGNSGPGTALNVVLTDPLPAQVRFLGFKVGAGSCSVAAGVLTCNVASLAPGATFNVQIDTQVTAPFGVIVNTATVSGNVNDPNPANNSAITDNGILSSTISGRVTSTGGLAGATIDVLLGCAGCSGQVITSTVTNADGFYTTPLLSSNQYIVRARANGFGTQYWQNSLSEALATVVMVGAADVLGINFALSSGATATIQGTVRDAGGAALVGAVVEVLDTNGTVLASTTVPGPAPNGGYAVGVAPGTYKLRARLNGFGTTYWDGKRTVSAADPITVAAGQIFTADITLPIAGAIAGQVIAADTLQGLNLAVQIYDAATNQLVAFATAAGGTGAYQTDFVLAPGTYKVMAFPPPPYAPMAYNQKTTVQAADFVTVTAGQVRSGIDITVPRGGTISGRITRAGTGVPGEGIPGAFVNVAEAGTNIFLTGATTLADGSYATPRLVPGSYKVRAQARGAGFADLFYVNGVDLTTATPVMVTADVDTQNINIAMTAGGTIRGTIRDRSGNPISAASVFLGRFGANAFGSPTFAATLADGTYTISGVRDGEWNVRVVKAGYQVAFWSGAPDNPATDGGMASLIPIAGGNTVTADVNLTPGGGTIKGRVTRSDNGQPVPAGTGVQALFGQFARNAFVQQAATDANGIYTLTGLPPGPYVVQAVGNHAAGFAFGWYPSGALNTVMVTNVSMAVPFDVADGETVIGKDFVVAAGEVHRIRGVVRAAGGGAPIRDGFVSAVDPTSNANVRGVALNADGSYEINALPPGRYVLRATTPAGYSNQHSDNQPLFLAARVITLGGGNPDPFDADFTLTPDAATIAGRILRSDTGQPVAGVSLNLRTAYDRTVFGATSDRNGNFLLRGIPPGSYKLRASEPTLVTQWHTTSGVGGLTFDAASFITLGPGEGRAGVNVSMGPGAGTITGRIVREVMPGVAPPAGNVVVNAREVSSGGSVTLITSRADGTFVVNGLPGGDYTLRFFDSGLAAEWYQNKPTRETATAIHVTPPATVTTADVVMSDVFGTVSGLVVADDGGAPVPGASIILLDPGGGLAPTGGATGATGTNGSFVGRFGIAPGVNAYVAQARALGYASNYFVAGGGLGSPSLGGASRISITTGADTGGLNFRLTRSSDLTGAVSYAGSKKGPLVVELYTDPGFTPASFAYRLTFASPTFPKTFGFMSPAPDTSGILPGTYYVRAFIDASPNGALDSGEPSGTAGPFVVTEGNATGGANVTLTDPVALINLAPVAGAETIVTSVGAATNLVLSGTDAETAPANLTYTVPATTAQGGTLAGADQFWTYTPPFGFTGTDSFVFTVTDRGNPDGCGAVTATCAGALTSAPATVTIAVNPAGTNAFADSVEVVTSPTGAPSGPQFLGDVEIDETVNGSLSTNGSVTLTLPAGLTFAPGSTPGVSTRLSNGLTVGAPAVNGGRTQLSFAVTARSTRGPAKILISNIAVVVAPGFVSDLFDSLPVVVSVGGINGITPAQVTNGTAIRQGAAPVLDKVSPVRAAQSVQGYPLTLTGANFAIGAQVTLSGGGITVGAAAVNSSAEIQVAITVAANAALGARDVTVTQTGPDGIVRSSTLPAALTITPPPTVVSTDRTLSVEPANPLRRGRTTQRVNVTGLDFQAPTTSPPNLVIEFGSGLPFVADPKITVEAVGFTATNAVWADVAVAFDADLGPRLVRVTNPDGGVSQAVQAVDVADPTVDTPPTLNAPPSKTVTSTTPAPSIGSLSPNAALLGASIVIGGSNFSSTPSANSVTFAGANSTRVSATVTQAGATSLTVTVPSQAVDGSVTVAVNGQLSNAAAFTVTSPRLSSVIPSSAEQGTLLTGATAVKLSGAKLVQGARAAVTSNGVPVAGIGVSNETLDLTSGGTVLTATFNLTSAPLGVFDVTVTNPDGGAATLPGGFEVRARSTVTILVGADNRAYLPSVNAVTVSLNGNGACTAKTIVPVATPVQITFNGGGTPAALRVRIESSTLPGTATNEDCEPGQTPAPDYTIGLDDGVTQTVDVPGAAGIYLTTLYSRDMGGTVTIHVLDLNNSELGSLRLPVDDDGDGLPTAWEQAVGLNPNNADQDGNGIVDDNDRFARDGFTNYEKFRGVWLVGPAAGSNGAMGGHMRLDPRKRHLFVRGQGYANDPAISAAPGTCGWDRTNLRAVPDPTLSPSNPCPRFEVGPAFEAQGIRVVDVTASFAPGVSQLPRASMVDGSRPIVDMATMTYDGIGCNGGEACDQTGKAGIRQWSFATLGVSSYGSAGTYGAPRVVKRAVESYFNNRPYQHRTNDPTRVVTGPDGRPMLAPITLVGDGNDNGLVDRRETTVNGQLAGDTFIDGLFSLDLSSLDVNNDGCVELPNVGDPTTLATCNPAGSSAAYPQATKQQVVRHVTTHELGHAVGVNLHTTEADCVMYQYSTDWIRDGHFGPTAAPLLQIHNKGGVQ